MEHDSIAVLDFGGQYVHLIATKVRSLGVHAEIRDPDDPVLSFGRYKGLILSGSPALSAYDADSNWSRGVLDLGIPVLGFCFGHQEIAKHAGGSVKHTKREYGAATLHIIAESPIFRGLQTEELVWMSHGDTVTKLPDGFVELGYSNGGGNSSQHRFAAIASAERRQYGLQFHPEVDDTPGGTTMLKNFVLEICGAKQSWAVGDQVEERALAIREEVGDRDVLLLVSGGVDSTVAALLFKRAIGSERLKLLHIDNGLMRKNESAGVKTRLTELGLGESLRVADASDVFLDALHGVVDPEKKRKAIGDTKQYQFIRNSLKKTATIRKVLERQLLAVKNALLIKRQAEASADFTTAMGLMAGEIGKLFGETDLVKTQADWEKAMVQSQTMEERMSMFLDTIEDIAEQDVELTASESATDEEIDRLIEAEAEAEQAKELGKLADLRAELDALKGRSEKQK